jgi:Fe-S-cluster containining protein
LKGSLEKNYNNKNKLQQNNFPILVRILDNTVPIIRDFAFVFPRHWEIQCKFLNNAISIVRNCAFIYYSFRKSSLGFSIIKLPIVRDSACIFLRLWENQCRILND